MRKNSEKCLICGKTEFKNSNSFTKHLRLHHISSKNYYLFYIDYTAGICNICSKEIKFSSIDEGFPKLCQECNNKRNPNRIQKIKETMIEKYGVENASQSIEIQEKKKQTNLKRYGVEYTHQNKTIMQCCLDTWKQNYEEGHPGRTPEIKSKKKKTCQEKYGVDNPLQVKEFREKKDKTCEEKFGNKYPMRTLEGRKLSEEGMFKKYGVKNALELPEFLEKSRRTNQKNRGTDWPMQDPEIVEKISGENSYRWVEDRVQRFAPYTEKFFEVEFRNQIKIEQKNLDPITEDPLKEDAHLHHIDYDKTNDSRINLVFLNKNIHFKTNTNREHWYKILSDINNDICENKG